MKADDRGELRTRIWYTADGRDVQVRQMEASHIENCIGLILGKWPRWRARYLFPLRAELRRRGLPVPLPFLSEA